MLILLAFAFASGLFTILAPCIWPLLPIVFSTSASHPSRWRPLGLTMGIVGSFAIFTLVISSLVRLLHVDPDWFRYIAVVVLVFFGISLLWPRLNQWVEVKIGKVSRFWIRPNQSWDDGFVGGLVTGISLGIVWSPCAGPILATIAALSATEHLTIQVLLVTAVYAAGIAVPLFAFAYGSQKLVFNWKVMSKHARGLQIFFGCTTILTALLIITNYDKTIEAGLLNAFPQYSSALNAFEGDKQVQQQLNQLKKSSAQIATDQQILNVSTVERAAEFKNISHWLNSGPLTLSALKGKVVLVDFWTYTCINCIRTLPYLTNWYSMYHDQGFEIVGVHTPEFAFEKDTHNVASALKRYGITYPVAQDNDYGTWQAYNNNYWPAEYLIDATGKIRRIHNGEGEYDVMEKAIQLLLKENGQTVNQAVSSKDTTTPQTETSPETYLGSGRMEYYDSIFQLQNGSRSLDLEDRPQINTFSLGGQWLINSDSSQAGKEAMLAYNFVADHVYLVMRPGSSTNGRVTVFLDDQPISKTESGSDVENGHVSVDTDRLYELVNLHGKTGNHILKLQFDNGIEIFAFTFG